VLVVFAPQGQIDRIGTTVTATDPGQEGSALSGRWAIWQASGRAFLESPVGGVGLDAHRLAVAYELGQVRVLTGSEKEAHNAYLSVLTETGVVGIVLFIFVLLDVVTSVRRLRGWDAWYWSCQLAVLAIGAMSLSLEDSKSVWIFLSLSVCFAAAPHPALAAIRRDWAAETLPFGTAFRPQSYR
jgi:O-antigen ligase